MEKLMDISHVGYSYHTMQGETPALTNINFTVHKGDFLAIVGPSGCGNAMVALRKQRKQPVAENCWLSCCICFLLQMHIWQPLIFAGSCSINGCHR